MIVRRDRKTGKIRIGPAGIIIISISILFLLGLSFQLYRFLFAGLREVRGESWPVVATPTPWPTPSYRPGPNGLTYDITTEVREIGGHMVSWNPEIHPSQPRRESWTLEPKPRGFAAAGQPIVPPDVQEWVIHDLLEDINGIKSWFLDPELRKDKDYVRQFATGLFLEILLHLEERPNIIIGLASEAGKEQINVHFCPETGICHVLVASSEPVEYVYYNTKGEPVDRKKVLKWFMYEVRYEDGRWKLAETRSIKPPEEGGEE